MTMIKREDLLELGFEDFAGPVLESNFDYIVVRYYIHKDKPWIGIEEHYPREQQDEIDPSHVVSAAINYGTKNGEIVYSKDEVTDFLAHQGKMPYSNRTIH